MKTRNHLLVNIIPFATMFVSSCIILWIGREYYKEAAKVLMLIGMIIFPTCALITGDWRIIPNTIIGAAIPTCICTISVIIQLKLWLIITLLIVAILLMVKLLIHYWKREENTLIEYEVTQEQEPNKNW